MYLNRCVSVVEKLLSLKMSGNKLENNLWQTPPAPSVLRWMLSLRVMMEEHLCPSIMLSCERLKPGIFAVHDTREKDRRTNWWTTYRVSKSSAKYDECFKHRDRQTGLVDGGSPGDTHMMVLRGRTDRRCNEGDEGWNRPSSQGFLVLCTRDYLR